MLLREPWAFKHIVYCNEQANAKYLSGFTARDLMCGGGGPKIAYENVAHHGWAAKKIFFSKALRDSKTASFLL